MADLATFTNRAELVQAVRGKPDRVILAEAEAAGVEMILQKIFMGMMMTFDPSRAAGRSATIEYDISVPGGPRHRYQVNVQAGECTIDPAAGGKPTVALRTNLATFLKLSTNSANPLMLILFRKLRVEGDRKLAAELKTWFSRRV